MCRYSVNIRQPPGVCRGPVIGRHQRSAAQYQFPRSVWHRGRPSLASSPTNPVPLPYQQLAMISMPVPDPSMPLPTSRGPLTSVQVDDHGALLHAAELLAALFRRTLAEAPLMTRENLGVWLDWHTRLEGLMVRGLTT